MKHQRPVLPRADAHTGFAFSQRTEFYDYFQCRGAEIVKITVATRRSNLLLRAAPLPGERLRLKENNSRNGDLYPLVHI